MTKWILAAVLVLMALPSRGMAQSKESVVSNENAMRYVAFGGSDTGMCTSLAAACASVEYALEQLPGGHSQPPTAGNGTVLVFSGQSPKCALWNPTTSPSVGLGLMAANASHTASNAPTDTISSLKVVPIWALA